MHTPAVTSAQMKALEAAANAKGLSYDEMMRRAGEGCAKKVLEILDTLDPQRHTDILVLVGPGNNGGDGLVCGSYALQHLRPNACVHFLLWKRHGDFRSDKDWPLRRAFDSQQDSRARLGEDGSSFGIYDATDNPQLRHELDDASIVVDALLGTGQHGPFLAELEEILVAIRREQQRKPDLQVVAVDIPTGINADTGEAISENYVRADITCTFAYPKPGLLQGKGEFAAGKVEVLDIGFGEVGVSPASVLG